MPFRRAGSLNWINTTPGSSIRSSKPVNTPWRISPPKSRVEARARVAGHDRLAILVGGDDVEVGERLTVLAADRRHRRLGGELVAGPDLRDEAHAVLGEPAVADPVRE